MPPLEEFPRSHTSEAPDEDNYSKSGNKRQPEKQISEVRFRDLCSYYGEACEGYDGNVVGHEHSLVPPREFWVDQNRLPRQWTIFSRGKSGNSWEEDSGFLPRPHLPLLLTLRYSE